MLGTRKNGRGYQYQPHGGSHHGSPWPALQKTPVAFTDEDNSPGGYFGHSQLSSLRTLPQTARHCFAEDPNGFSPTKRPKVSTAILDPLQISLLKFSPHLQMPAARVSPHPNPSPLPRAQDRSRQFCRKVKLGVQSRSHLSEGSWLEIYGQK